MDPSTTGLDRAIGGESVRLAVFDVAIRRHTGQWRRPDRVALQEVTDRFGDVRGARLDDGRLLLPLHEEDGADPTGEVVIADPTANPPRIEFYDFSVGDRVERPIDELADTPLAWRLRFWTSAYTPADPPGFLEEAGVASSVSTSAAATVAGGQTDAREWIDRVRSALVTARDDQRTRRRHSYGTGADESAIDESGGITGLVCDGKRVDEYGQQVVTLARAGDDEEASLEATDLAAGDDVLVTGKAPGLPIEAELFALAADHVDLGVYWDTAAADDAEAAFTAEADHRFGIAPLVTSAPYDAVEGALRSLDRRERATAVYAGTATIRFDEPPALPDWNLLNRDQRRAVERGLAAEDVCCVSAPPWTGGRRTIHAIVDACVSTDRTVGVYAPAPGALERLFDTASGDDLVTLATGRDVRYARLDRDDDTGGDPWQADIVGVAIGHTDPTSELTFDVGIVDQAARVDVAAGAIPFSTADRIVLIGDPNQLPPERPLTARTADLPRSIYEHVAESYGEDAIVPLRCQYAMNQAIAMYSNAQYYDGRLIHGQRNRTWTVDALAPLEPVHARGAPQQSPTGSWHHDGEAAAAMAEVDALLDRGVAGEDIGIVAPASAQVGKVRAGLDERNLSDAGILVGPPDALACGARDVVIVSMLAGVEGGYDWTHEALNVGLTRAKRRLVIVANWDQLTTEAPAEATDPARELAAFLERRGLLPEDR